jgi:hypothetical protein
MTGSRSNPVIKPTKWWIVSSLMLVAMPSYGDRVKAIKQAVSARPEIPSQARSVRMNPAGLRPA